MRACMLPQEVSVRKCTAWHVMAPMPAAHFHDIRTANLLHASVQVIDFELQRQLAPYMRNMQPLPGVFDPDFIAANQGARADHLVKGSKQVWLESSVRGGG